MAYDPQGPSWFTVWDDLPDPTSNQPFQVHVTEEAFLHICPEHVLGENDRWRELLDSALADRFVRWAVAPRADPSLPEEVAAKLKPQVADGLKHPCCLDIVQKNTAGETLHATREVITRCGLLVVIRRFADANYLWTAYFPWATATERPQRRWLAALRSRVERYPSVATVQDKKFLVLPSAEEQFDSIDPSGYRTDLHFVTPEKWGFRQITINDESMWVWKSPPGWPVPPVVPKDVLKNPKLPRK